ncbi:hypothetical protein [Pseudomonas sp.]|uniref:hypothetical protein n=1 Tax=Pseudomonas sp. TaxID=306 RepID=UPI002FCAA5AE
MTSHGELLRTIRSASFNDEAAAELLLEIRRLGLAPKLSHRLDDIAIHMHHDARALEALYLALSSGRIVFSTGGSADDQDCAASLS